MKRKGSLWVVAAVFAWTSVTAGAQAIVPEFAASVTLGIQPLAVRFVDTTGLPAGSGAEYNWSFGDGQNATGRDVIHVFETPGTYSVSLAIHLDGNIHTTTKQSLITVLQLTPNFSATGRTGNAPQTVQFSNLTINSGLATSYVWNFGDGTTSTAFAPSHTYAEVGVYAVSLKATTIFGSRTETKRAFVVVGTPDEGRSHVVVFMPTAEEHFGDIQSSSSPNLTIHVSSQFRTWGLISRPQTGSLTSFELEPQQVRSFSFPSSAIVNTDDGSTTRAIEVFGEHPIQVHAVTADDFSTDGYATYSVDTFGTRYRVMTMPSYGLETEPEEENELPVTIFLYPAQLAVAAIADDTVVSITPSVSVGARAADVPFEVHLSRSSVYQLRAGTVNADLSGTLVESNKPVAVYSGNELARVGADFTDHVIEQLPPVAAWGVEHIAMPSATRVQGDTFRIVADTSPTTVTFGAGGANPVVLNAGQFVERPLAATTLIAATAPVLVAQFANGGALEAPEPELDAMGDPYMTILAATTRFTPELTFTTPTTGFGEEFESFVNIVALTPDASNGLVLVDNIPVDPEAFSIVDGTAFSVTSVPVPHGRHSVLGLNPVMAYAYGFSSFESYGFALGNLSGELTPSEETRTPEEIALFFRQVFDIVDLDGDRLISVFEALNVGVPGHLTEALDADSNGFLSLAELLEATVGPVGVDSPVFADFAKTTLGAGTSGNPFHSLREATTFVREGGIVKTVGGQSRELFPELHPLEKRLKIEPAANKPASVGVLPPAPPVP